VGTGINGLSEPELNEFGGFSGRLFEAVICGILG